MPREQGVHPRILATNSSGTALSCRRTAAAIGQQERSTLAALHLDRRLQPSWRGHAHMLDGLGHR